MKCYLFIFLSAIFLFTACSNKEKTVTTVAADGTISETALPKGKFIIDDETALTNIPQDPSVLNGHHGQDTDVITSNTKENPETNIKHKYKNLLVFYTDDTMKINKPYIATLILAKDQKIVDLEVEVLEASNARGNKVKVKDTSLEIGTAMKAKLKDFSGSVEKGFDIDFMGDEGMEQRITEKRKQLMWQWKLTPLTAGEQKLSLSITVTEKNGEKVNLPIRSIPIIIYAESTGSQIMSFIQKNYQWLLATLLLPLFLGWYNARLRHKFDQKTMQQRDKQQQAFNVNPPSPNTTQNNQGGA